MILGRLRRPSRRRSSTVSKPSRAAVRIAFLTMDIALAEAEGDTGDERPCIPPWDQDLPLAPDPAVEQVLALLRADPSLCARLRRELARLP